MYAHFRRTCPRAIEVENHAQVIDALKLLKNSLDTGELDQAIITASSRARNAFMKWIMGCWVTTYWFHSKYLNETEMSTPKSRGAPIRQRFAFHQF